MQYQPNAHNKVGPLTAEDTDDTRCEDCNGELTTNDDGEYLCDDCGLIVEEYHIDPGPSYTAFSSEDWRNKTHHGSPNNIAQPLNGLGTVFYTNTDGRGRTIAGNQRSWYRRLKSHHDIYDKNRERNHKNAFNELNALGARLGISEHVQTGAAKIYRRAFEHDLIRGRSIEGMVSGSLLIAIRKHKIPRSAADLAEFGHVDEGEIYGAFRYIRAELNIPTPPPSPFQWFSKLASKLDLPAHIRTGARTHLEKIQESGAFSGRDPKGLAVATMYATFLYNHEEPFSQKDASQAAGVGKQTVSSITSAILERDGLELRDLHPWFKNPLTDLKEFAEKFDLPVRTRKRAEHLLEGITDTEYLDDRLPKPAAMAAVTIASIKTGYTGLNESAVLEYANQSADILSVAIRNFNATFGCGLRSTITSASFTTGFLGAVVYARKLTGSSLSILQEIGENLTTAIETRTGVTLHRNASATPRATMDGEHANSEQVKSTTSTATITPTPGATRTNTRPPHSVAGRPMGVGRGDPGTSRFPGLTRRNSDGFLRSPSVDGSAAQLPHPGGGIRARPPPSTRGHTWGSARQSGPSNPWCRRLSPRITPRR